MIRNISERRINILKWAIVLIVTAAVYLIPPSGDYTVAMSKYFTITIFVVMLFAFSLFDTTYIALAIPILYILAKIASPQIAFSGWLQSTVWMMLGAVILGDIIDESGILKRLTYWFVVKFGGSYLGVLFGMTFCGIVLAYMAPNAGAALFFVLAFGMCRAMDIKANTPMALLLFYTAQIAGNVAPILLSYDAMFDAAMSLCQTSFGGEVWNIDYLTYAKHNIIHLPLIFLLVYIPYKIWHGDKVKVDLEYIRTELTALGKITLREKKAALLMVILMMLFLSQKFTGLAVYMCFMVTLLIAFLPGISLGTAETLHKANYPIAFFIAGCLAIGAVGNSIGVGAVMGKILLPLMGEGILRNAGMAFLFGYVINLLLTPMAGVAVLTIPIVEHLLAVGIAPLPIIYVMISGLNNTLFPYESAAYVLLFSYRMISMKQFMQIFTVRTIITMIYDLTVSTTYWQIIGLY